MADETPKTIKQLQTAAGWSDEHLAKMKADLDGSEEKLRSVLETWIKINEEQEKSLDWMEKTARKEIEKLKNLEKAEKLLGRTEGHLAHELKTRQAILDVEKEREKGNEKKTKELQKQQAAIDAQVDGLNESAGVLKRFTGITAKPTTLIGQLAGGRENFAAGLIKGMREALTLTKVLTSALDKVVETSIALATSQDKAIVNFRRATGATGVFDESIVALEKDMYKWGVSSDEAGQAHQELFLNVTDFTTMLPEQSKELASNVALLNELGIASATTTKNIQFAIKVMGKTPKEAAKFQRELFSFAQDLGVSAKMIAEDLGTMGPMIAALGDTGEDAFRKLEVQAKNTGLSLKEILGIVEKFDKFDTAAQSVGKLNALLGGPYLNTLELVAETDPSKRFEILKTRIDQAGVSFDEMDYYQKKALASAVGLNEQQLALMMRGRIDLIREPGKSAADLEKLAEQQKEFNEVSAEAMEVMRMFAVSLRPFVVILKDILEYMQSWSDWAIVVTGAILGLGVVVATVNLAMGAFIKYQTASELLSKINTITTAVHASVVEADAAATTINNTAKAAAIAPTTGLTAATWSLTTAQLASAGAIAFLLGAIAALVVVFLYDAGSPGLIVIVGMMTAAMLALAVATNVFGWSTAGVMPFILAFGAAVLMIGAGIGIAAGSMAMLVTSISEFGAGLAGSLLITATAISSIVKDINTLDTFKTVTLGATMVAATYAAPAATLASAGVAAVTRGMGGGEDAGAGAGALPPVNIHLSIELDGREFEAAVNNVEVKPYGGPGLTASKLHQAITTGALSVSGGSSVA